MYCIFFSWTVIHGDCSEVVSQKSGEYMLQLEENGPQYRVYCDQESDGGGWLVSISASEYMSQDIYISYYSVGIGNGK